MEIVPTHKRHRIYTKLCRLTKVTGYTLITNALDQNPASRIRHLLRFEEIFSLFYRSSKTPAFQPILESSLRPTSLRPILIFSYLQRPFTFFNQHSNGI